MKKAIAISAYDSFEEVRVLVDLIRHNWKEDYLITVYCNHPAGQTELAGLEVDRLIVEENIHYEPGMPKGVLVYRGWRAIGQSCMTAAELGASSVFHLFSDSWPLSEDEYLNLESRLHKEDLLMMARGEEGMRGHMCPLSSISDMFLFLRGDFLRANPDFFTLNPFDLPLDILNIHGVLSIQVFSRIGYSKLCFYDRGQNTEIIPGRMKDNRCADPAYPVNYDTRLHFLHVHTACFPGNWGQRLQAYYLERFNLTEGKHIKDFIRRHKPDGIQGELEAFYLSSEKKLSLRLIKPADMGQEPKRYLAILTIPYPMALAEGIKIRIESFLIDLINRMLPKVGIGQTTLSRTIRYNGMAAEHFKKLYGGIDFSRAKHEIWFDKNESPASDTKHEQST